MRHWKRLYHLKYVFSLCMTVLLSTVAWTQTANVPITATQSLNSEGAMEGVTLGRTRTYSTSGIAAAKELLWKSTKLFRIDYGVALSMNFDGSSGTVAEIGFSEPVLTNDLIYFELCVSLKQNFIVALDSQIGKQVWIYATKDALSAPAIAGDTLFVLAADNNLYALDALTGKEKWHFSSPDRKETWDIFKPPAVKDGVVYIVSMAGNIFALDIETKQPKWVFKNKNKARVTAPAFDAATGFLADEKGVIYAIDLKSGQEKWNTKVKGEAGLPIIANESVFLRTNDGVMHCLDAKTGASKWSAKIGDKVQDVFPITSVRIGTALAHYERTIFFGSSEKGSNFLFAVEASTGQIKWKYKIEAPCRAPVVAGGTVYLGGFGALYAVDVKTGKETWKIEAQSEFEGKKVKNVVSSPIVTNGSIYFVNDDGFFYAIR